MKEAVLAEDLVEVKSWDAAYYELFVEPFLGEGLIAQNGEPIILLRDMTLMTASTVALMLHDKGYQGQFRIYQYHSYYKWNPR